MTDTTDQAPVTGAPEPEAGADDEAGLGLDPREEPSRLFNLMPGTLDVIEALGSPGDGWKQFSYVPTGFGDLDALLGSGLAPGTLTLVASRPSIGCSTLLLDFCRSAAIQHQLPTTFVSYQAAYPEIIMRLVCAEGRIPVSNTRSGMMNDDDWTRMAKRMGDTVNMPLSVATCADWTCSELIRRVTTTAAVEKTRLIVVDSLNDIRSDAHENRERQVAEAARDLKALALKLGVPVVAGAQLNRQVEARTSKRPELWTDLRDSDAPAHVADTVIMLYREDAYERESPRAGEADLMVTKNRNGQRGTVTLAFQGHYSRFVQMA